MIELRHKCWVKGTMDEGGDPKSSQSWVSARRAWFNIYDDQVECGDWTILASNVEEAVLVEARQWFIPVRVLRIRTHDAIYQFGFNPWCNAGKHLPFEFERKKARIAYSPFSIALRVGLVLLLAYLIWRKCG